MGINSMSISYDRNYMVFSAKVLDQNIEDQLVEMNMVDDANKENRCRIELYQFSLADAYALKDANFKPIFKNGNPLGPILDSSIAVSKNLVATVGTDRYLRIWEYSIKNASTVITMNLSTDSMETTYRQLSCYFSKEVLNTVSVHPMGFQLAVGTREGVKIFYILEDEIKLAIELHGKICLCLKYANGGHFLAAGSGTNILIIDPYTFQTQFTLSAHPSYVRFLKWTESDSHLLSNCMQGSSYGWYSNFEIYNKAGNFFGMEGMKDTNKNDPTEPERIEFIIKNVTVNSFVYDEEYDVLCYATSDGILTLMTTSGGSKPYLKIPAIEDAEITSL